LARRARIVLLANGEGWSNQAIADKLDIHKSDITVWTKRWMERKDDPVPERLGDRPRSMSLPARQRGEGRRRGRGREQVTGLAARRPATLSRQA
jgi:transposase